MTNNNKCNKYLTKTGMRYKFIDFKNGKGQGCIKIYISPFQLGQGDCIKNDFLVFKSIVEKEDYYDIILKKKSVKQIIYQNQWDEIANENLKYKLKQLI